MKPNKLLLFVGLLALPFLLTLALNLGVVSVSAQEVATGVARGRLLPCPPGADCVTSESDGSAAHIAPLVVTGDPQRAFDDLVGALVQLRGARLLEAEDGYARLLFTTAYLKLADELELRLERESSTIHLRAFARVDAPWVDSARPLAESVRGQWVPRRSELEPASAQGPRADG